MKSQQKKTCFDVLGNFTAELKCRFDENHYVLEAAIATDPQHISFLSFQLMQQFVESYFTQFDINSVQLQSQVEVARNMFVQSPSAESGQVRQYVELTPLAVYACLCQMAPAFPDLIKFFQLILCFPVSSASAERSFSAMRRIKTYLRASMSEQRLSGLAVLSVERKLSSALLKEPSAVIDRFAQMGTRRLLLNN